MILLGLLQLLQLVSQGASPIVVEEEGHHQVKRQTTPLEWIVGQFSQCSLTCGGGVRVRSVRCLNRDGIITPEGCDGDRPVSYEFCNQINCTTFIPDITLIPDDGLLFFEGNEHARVQFTSTGPGSYTITISTIEFDNTETTVSVMVKPRSTQTQVSILGLSTESRIIEDMGVTIFSIDGEKVLQLNDAIVTMVTNSLVNFLGNIVFSTHGNSNVMILGTNITRFYYYDGFRHYCFDRDLMGPIFTNGTVYISLNGRTGFLSIDTILNYNLNQIIENLKGVITSLPNPPTSTDLVVSIIPSTSTDMEAASTDPPPSTDMEAASTDPPPSTDMEAASTDPPPSTDMEAASPDPPPSTDMEAASTDPSPSTDMEAASTDPSPSTDMEAASTDPPPSTDMEAASTDPPTSTDMKMASIHSPDQLAFTEPLPSPTMVPPTVTLETDDPDMFSTAATPTSNSQIALYLVVAVLGIIVLVVVAILITIVIVTATKLKSNKGHNYYDAIARPPQLPERNVKKNSDVTALGMKLLNHSHQLPLYDEIQPIHQVASLQLNSSDTGITTAFQDHYEEVSEILQAVETNATAMGNDDTIYSHYPHYNEVKPNSQITALSSDAADTVRDIPSQEQINEESHVVETAAGNDDAIHSHHPYYDEIRPNSQITALEPNSIDAVDNVLEIPSHELYEQINETSRHAVEISATELGICSHRTTLSPYYDDDEIVQPSAEVRPLEQNSGDAADVVSSQNSQHAIELDTRARSSDDTRQSALFPFFNEVQPNTQVEQNGSDNIICDIINCVHETFEMNVSAPNNDTIVSHQSALSPPCDEVQPNAIVPILQLEPCDTNIVTADNICYIPSQEQVYESTIVAVGAVAVDDNCMTSHQSALSRDEVQPVSTLLSNSSDTNIITVDNVCYAPSQVYGNSNVTTAMNHKDDKDNSHQTLSEVQPNATLPTVQAISSDMDTIVTADNVCYISSSQEQAYECSGAVDHNDTTVHQSAFSRDEVQPNATFPTLQLNYSDTDIIVTAYNAPSQVYENTLQ